MTYQKKNTSRDVCNTSTKSIIGLAKEKDLQDFLKQLLKDVSDYSLKEIDQDTIFKASKIAFKILQSYKQGAQQVEISQIADNSVVTVVVMDKPFIVDSINNALRSYGIENKLLICNTFISSDKKNDTVYKVGVIQFYSRNWFDEKFYDNLSKNLSEVLDCVDLVVQNWQKMRANLDYYTERHCLISKPNHCNISEEEISFLKFLLEGNFIFLGYGLASIEDDSIAKIIKNESIGLLENKQFEKPYEALKGLKLLDRCIDIQKSRIVSNVHRKSSMLRISIRFYDEAKKSEFVHVFYGFLVTKIDYMSVMDIPLIREKVNYTINKYSVPSNSHHAKELVNALEEFPRSELLEISREELYEVAVNIVSLTINPRIKLFIRKDRNDRYVSCLIFIPKLRFNTVLRNRIEQILCDQFHGAVARHYVKIGEGELTRLQVIINLPENQAVKYSVSRIEHLITKAVNVWEDNLKEVISKDFQGKQRDMLFMKYRSAFNVQYINTFSPEQSIHDIKSIETVLEKNEAVLKIYNSAKSGKNVIQMKVFSLGVELYLSAIFPIIDNIGFFIFDVATFETKIKHLGEEKQVYIHYLRTRPKHGEILLNESQKYNVELGLRKIWQQEVENDCFNSLIYYIDIDYRQTNLLRAYAKYLKQINFAFLYEFILETLLKYPNITKDLVNLFYAKFAPSYKGLSVKQVLKNLKSNIDQLKIFSDDKIFGALLNVIEATKRTNFFKKDEQGQYKSFVALKIASKEVIDMPLPMPEYDTFVFSADFEAIHLRGAKIARGGLRWTDRVDDFRKVVLDLMKAQMTKNSLIVPQGCKGGFVVKKQTESRADFLKVGVECYKNFLRGILDITDNIVNGDVITPAGIRCYDGDDPYFVVAADKGTASFSDYANGISQEYNYWLGDAFASGGSVGYDHKKMGITAKGAWVCVNNHFHSADYDINKNTFTVVGIGDMSGDVFGNGMLLSKNIKLIAAFNHMHIFIDPDPDPRLSYKERLRLFKKDGSKWSDYNSNLISAGGGVFDRTTKQISVSKNMQNVLKIPGDHVSPNTLIRYILKAEVDLLWNGGIGTYVKGQFEDDTAIGDKVNDNLRILGKELNCKVVGEGGNLGFTQKGRIEYASRGGRINTDFIDNSAGVDCSDHEVNIKIALEDAMRVKAISLKKRNEILESLTQRIEELVLLDNYQQSLLLDLELSIAAKKLDDYAWFISYLEERGELKRSVEGLPSSEDLQKLQLEKGFLTRPEIAVLAAYSKNYIAKILNQYDFTNNEFFENILFSYFPEFLQNNYSKFIKQHKLSNDIITTIMSNDFVNILGITMFHQLADYKEYNPKEIIVAFYITLESLEVRKIWQQVQGLSTKITSNVKLKLLSQVMKTVKRSMNWLLANLGEIDDIKKTLAVYKDSFNKLKVITQKDKYLFDNIVKIQISKTNELAEGTKAAKDVVLDISFFSLVGLFFDISLMSQTAKVDLKHIAKIYFQIRDRFYIARITDLIIKHDSADQIGRLANDYLENELRLLTRELTLAQIKAEKSSDVVSDNPEFIADIDRLEKYDNYVKKMLHETNAENNYLIVQILIKKLQDLLNSSC